VPGGHRLESVYILPAVVSGHAHARRRRVGDLEQSRAVILLSILKSGLLSAADGFNGLVGGPQPFNRAALRDPSASFADDMARRDAIAAAAELELSGFVKDGVFVAALPNDLGDCAIWQGVYTAMCTMRWSAKPNAENQAAMLAAANALARYFYSTSVGTSILVRGAMPLALEGTFFSVDPANASRYFTDNYAGVPYVYREDASLDSLLGVMFGAAIVARFGDAPSRAALSSVLGSFSFGFTRAGFKITNRDGSPTTYGDCSPGFIQAPVRTLAGALPSLVAGDNTWQWIARSFAPEFSTTDTQAPGKISYVNAHLAILANLTFVCAAPAGSPGVGEAADGLRALLSKYEDVGNSFLVYAAARLGVAPRQSAKDKADKVLVEFPIGPKPKKGFNDSVAPAMQPVPVWQRPPADVIWQRSPYPYSGSDSKAYNRLDYLLAHYFSRSSK
jgi:hypothetical protein